MLSDVTRDGCALLSWKHTCAAHYAEATDAWHAAQVWTIAQVVWHGASCVARRNLPQRSAQPNPSAVSPSK